ncbi:MAG TPA: hypothetical protein VKT28_22340 [Puia sp.]|nr:hypothetical protein [Puia sp.]
MYFYIGLTDAKGIGDIAKEELTIAEQLKNDTLLQISYNTLGIFFEIKSDYKPALEFYLKALHIAEKDNNLVNMAVFTSNISLIYIETKNYPQALNYLRRSEPLCTLPEVMRKHPDYIVGTHVNICEAFLGMDQPDSALKYVQLAKAENLSVKDESSEASILGDFGSVYEKLHDNDLAESYYHKSIAYSDSLQLLKYIADNSFLYSNFLYHAKRYNEANALALKSMHAAKLNDYKAGIISAAGVLRNSFHQLNKQDSAYYYSDMEVAYRDTVYNQQNLNQLQDMTFTEQLHQQEENHKIAEANEKAKHNIQYAGIAIGIITFIILFLLFSHSVIAGAKTIEVLGVIGLLITFEFINLLLEPSLISITGDSPLLMLLALVLIAALLVPAHHYLEGMISRHLVEKNKKLKIAAAHQILKKHEGDNPKQIY